jgi:pilus assembly protein CpaF
MGLYERVQAAEFEGGRERRRGDKEALDDLKKAVAVYVSPDELARLVTDNPRQARNEIRSACRRVFQQPQWAQRPPDANERLVQDLLDTVFGLGPLQGFIDDPHVTEVMVNGGRSVYVERDGQMERTSVVFADEAQIRALIDRVLAPLGRRVDESSPMVDARLASGHRVNIVIPPVALDGPTITIRKFTRSVMTLDDMQKAGSLDHNIRQLLEWGVVFRKNIAVVGGTGSGKTTMLNALSCVIPLEERIVTIEDSAELRFLEHPHVVRLEGRVPNAEGVGQITIRDLVRNALRMRPDRIVVGECRGAEALDMLQSMNTGHDGSLTTLHANSPEDMVMRLVAMVRFGSDLPVDVIEGIIASALDVVVQVQRWKDGRRFVSAVAEVEVGDGDAPCRVVRDFERNDPDEAGAWLRIPRWLTALVATRRLDGKEVARWSRESCLSAA